MLEATLVRWAAEKARGLLEPLDDRWAHTLAVVGCARRVAEAGVGIDGAILMAAAYLHDVGYADELIHTGHHGIDGGIYLRSLGHERLARLVAHHSAAAAEAHVRGLAAELEAFPCEVSPTADALTYCDVITGAAGEQVTLAERVTDVERRYGATHTVTRAIRAALPELRVAVARTEGRLAGQPAPDVRQ